MSSFFKFFSLIAICWILILNLKLYYSPAFSKIENEHYNIDLLNQLNFLERKIHSGAQYDMQNLYPEGFVFMTVLYGLSWCNFIESLPHEHELYLRGLEEIKWSIDQIQSKEGRITFDASLPLAYGAFYVGWTNYLLGAYLSIQNPSDRDPIEISTFQITCDQIKFALDSSYSPFLESYQSAAWPADMTVCMASLALHDKNFAPKYPSVLKQWIVDVEERTDQYGLIPHAANPIDGTPLESARGSSQSLMLNFLIEIDSTYARSKFPIYDSLFLDKRVGLPGIGEYPECSKGDGDIDSGPVIWNIGAAASIVGQRTMAKYGYEEIAIGIRNSIEAFGFSIELGEEKLYLFGTLPIADAFIAWSNSIEPNKKAALISNDNWRIEFHLYSFICISLFILLFYGTVALQNRKYKV